MVHQLLRLERIAQLGQPLAPAPGVGLQIDDDRFSDLDDVVDCQLSGLDPLSVQERPVGAPQVEEPESGVGRHDAAVLARKQLIADRHVDTLRTPHDHRSRRLHTYQLKL